MNKITIYGRLTKDVEVKEVKGNLKVAKFSVASNSRKGKEESTIFFDCSAWGTTGETIAKYLAKGRPVLLFGAMEQNRVEKDGQSRIFWNVRVESFSFVADEQSKQKGKDKSVNDLKEEDIDDDDMLF